MRFFYSPNILNFNLASSGVSKTRNNECQRRRHWCHRSSVVMTTNYGSASNDKVDIMATLSFQRSHYDDVIMGAMASQITSLTIVYSTIYSDADQRKHQSSASLAFVRGPVNSPHKWPVTLNGFPFHDVIVIFFKTQVAIKFHSMSSANIPLHRKPRLRAGNGTGPRYPNDFCSQLFPRVPTPWHYAQNKRM